MLLHHISSPSNKTASPRVGRGGKRGTTAGRGQKGQRAHAGRRILPAEHDLIQRLPKLRGRGTNSNKPFRAKPRIINLDNLEKIKDLSELKGIKILGRGEVTKAWQINGALVSKTAREKIEKAGGSIT